MIFPGSGRSPGRYAVLQPAELATAACTLLPGGPPRAAAATPCVQYGHPGPNALCRCAQFTGNEPPTFRLRGTSGPGESITAWLTEACDAPEASVIQHAGPVGPGGRCWRPRPAAAQCREHVAGAVSGRLIGRWQSVRCAARARRLGRP